MSWAWGTRGSGRARSLGRGGCVVMSRRVGREGCWQRVGEVCHSELGRGRGDGRERVRHSEFRSHGQSSQGYTHHIVGVAVAWTEFDRGPECRAERGPRRHSRGGGTAANVVLGLHGGGAGVRFKRRVIEGRCWRCSEGGRDEGGVHCGWSEGGGLRCPSAA